MAMLDATESLTISWWLGWVPDCFLSGVWDAATDPGEDPCCPAHLLADTEQGSFLAHVLESALLHHGLPIQPLHGGLSNRARKGFSEKVTFKPSLEGKDGSLLSKSGERGRFSQGKTLAQGIES